MEMNNQQSQEGNGQPNTSANQSSGDSSSSATNKPKTTKSLSKKVFIIGILLVFIVSIVAGLLIYKDQNDEPTYPLQASAIVSITDTAFEPQTISISKGGAVTWKNQSSTAKRIAAEPYPTGDSLPALDSEDIIGPGESYVFTFEQTGTFNYYEYSNPTEFKGTVIVE